MRFKLPVRCFDSEDAAKEAAAILLWKAHSLRSTLLSETRSGVLEKCRSEGLSLTGTKVVLVDAYVRDWLLSRKNVSLDKSGEELPFDVDADVDLTRAGLDVKDTTNDMYADAVPPSQVVPQRSLDQPFLLPCVVVSSCVANINAYADNAIMAEIWGRPPTQTQQKKRRRGVAGEVPHVIQPVNGVVFVEEEKKPVAIPDSMFLGLVIKTNSPLDVVPVLLPFTDRLFHATAHETNKEPALIIIQYSSIPL